MWQAPHSEPQRGQRVRQALPWNKSISKRGQDALEPGERLRTKDGSRASRPRFEPRSSHSTNINGAKALPWINSKPLSPTRVPATSSRARCPRLAPSDVALGDDWPAGKPMFPARPRLRTAGLLARMKHEHCCVSHRRLTGAGSTVSDGQLPNRDLAADHCLPNGAQETPAALGHLPETASIRK